MVNASDFRSESVKVNFMLCYPKYSQFSFYSLKLTKDQFNKTKKWTFEFILKKNIPFKN